MELSNALLSELKKVPGQTAQQLSARLGADKTSIRSLLYGTLKGHCYQDNEYRWYPTNEALKKTDRFQEPFTDTPLARLCRYYLSCLGHEDEGGIRVLAAGKGGDLDYTETGGLPLRGAETIFRSAGAQRLLAKLRKESGRRAMYFGYPTTLKRGLSEKSNGEGFLVEPIFLFYVEFDNHTQLPQLRQSFPIINLSVLRRFTSSEREAVMYELVQLEEELGLSGSRDIPELDELVPRLAAIRDEWPWKEEMDPARLRITPALGDINEEGIYNRGVLLIGERSPFTAGLESELKSLAKMSVSDYATTALGQWVSGKSEASVARPTEHLVEVLPLNVEQRRAVCRSLESTLTIVTGPPGTGKSQVVSDILINAVWRGKRVLFATKNNKAVDVVETRINMLGPRPILLRVGSNHHQGSLAEYLVRLLTATTTPDDQASFDEATYDQDQMCKKMLELDREQTRIIHHRNRVDELEQKIEADRATWPKEIFDAIKKLDLDQVRNAYQLFGASLRKATKNEQPLLIRLFWGFLKDDRYQNLLKAALFMSAVLSPLQLKFHDQAPNDATINQWRGLYATIPELIASVCDVILYYKALRTLQGAKPFEEISKERFLLVNEMARNAEKLWQAWLKTQPSRLTTSDRQLFTKYNSVLKMVMDAGANCKLENRLRQQYYEISPKIAHLVPCWAVTSLSVRGKIPFEPGFFDLVVIDEASQCDIASALPLLYRAKRVAVIGDPKQLSHISRLPTEYDHKLLSQHDLVQGYAHWAYSYNSLFDLASGLSSGEDIVNLRDHHRCHHDIIEFSNRFFYEKRLRVATRYDKLNRPGKNDRGVRWIQMSGDVVRPPQGGAVNLKEAEGVVGTLKKLISAQGYNGSIGVVSPFRAQANLIREMVNKDENLSACLAEHEFLCDTVHRFQGDERDVMIFSPVISKGTPPGALGFLRNNGNLFNVAITRARALLLVVGDQQAAAQSDVKYLADFSAYVLNLQNKEETGDQQTVTDWGPHYPAVGNQGEVSDWEKILYRALYEAGIRTIPQYRLERYALDLALFADDPKACGRRLDIEVDGERYHHHWTGESGRRDQLRNQRLYELGWDVMLFWVYEIRDDLEGCVRRVSSWLETT